MARLIDAMKTVTKMSVRIIPLIQMGANPTQVYNEVLQAVADAPTVDAVEVIRCRNCKHQTAMWCWRAEEGMNPRRVGSNDFCSYGERKDGDGNE